MPITFKVKSREGYLISKWTGTILDDEILKSYKEFFESNEWISGLNELVDLSKADMQKVHHFVILELGKYAEGFYKEEDIKKVKVAVYAPNDLPERIAELYRALVYGSQENIHIYRDLNEAIKWVKMG